MTRLEWNAPGTSIYETGVDRGVFYPRVGNGVPWNGLVTVEEAPSGGEHTPYYYDGVKYHNFIAAESFEASVEAYATPPEFAVCDGQKQLAPGLYVTEQPRQSFGFSYRTRIGNEVDENAGHKIHVVYNCKAGPVSRSFTTLSRTPAAPTRTWTFYTVPPPATTHRPTAHFVVDSRFVTSTRLTNLENKLYGTISTPPELPTPDQLKTILTS